MRQGYDDAGPRSWTFLPHRIRVASEQVRIWRPADAERILCMAGRTERYAIEPRGEYVFGAGREGCGRERARAPRRASGRLVAWDPSAGTAHRRRVSRRPAGQGASAAPSTESIRPGKRSSSSSRRRRMYLHTPCCRSAVMPERCSVLR